MQRIYYQTIIERINEPRRCIQIIEGPRQVGKSTVIRQVLETISIPWLHFAADDIPATRAAWISDCWEMARAKMAANHSSELLLVIDEIQRLSQWSSVVKKEWDADTFNHVNIKVILLGSSRVRLERGLSESLMGRFEVIKMPHWSYTEMREAFGMSLDEYVFYGGYPGMVDFCHSTERWHNYMRSSIVDATINNDILMDSLITKPALLRQTFELASAYSSQQLSVTKMLGQLQDAGNTTTLSGYLQLLGQCGLVTGLNKFSMDLARRRASVPKYQVYNNGLMTLYGNLDLSTARATPKVWGRIVESAVGAYLLNAAYAQDFQLYYWRDGKDEVDFVLVRYGKVVAIEVKSGDERDTFGLHRFRDMFHPYRTLIVGPNAFPLEDFLSMDITTLFD